MNDRRTLIARPPNPAAGAEFSLTAPEGYIYTIVSLSFTLKAANAGSARLIAITFNRNGSFFARVFSSVLHTINLTWSYSWILNGGTPIDLSAQTFLQHNLPDQIAIAGEDTLEIVIGGLQAADQLSNIVVGYTSRPDIAL